MERGIALEAYYEVELSHSLQNLAVIYSIMGLHNEIVNYSTKRNEAKSTFSKETTKYDNTFKKHDRDETNLRAHNCIGQTHEQQHTTSFARFDFSEEFDRRDQVDCN